MEKERDMKQSVLEALEILANHEGVDLGDDSPKIEFSEDRETETSKYNGNDKAIYISPNDSSNLAVYAEESAHALRDIVLSRKGQDYSNQDIEAHEFLGRLGETIVRNSCAGTSLEKLLDTEERNTSSQECREATENELGVLEKFQNQYREEKEGRESFYEVIVRNSEKVQQSIEEFNEGKIDREGLDGRVYGAGKELKKDLNGIGDSLSSLPNAMEEVDSYIYFTYKAYRLRKDSNNLDGWMEAFNKYVSPERIKEKFQHLEDSVEDNIEFEKIQVKVHQKPYEFAEQLQPSEIPRGIFSMSDREIKMRYFNDKSSKKGKVKNYLANLCFGKPEYKK